MSQLVQAKIISCEETTAPGIWVTKLEAPSLAAAARPGQFLHIRCGEGDDPLLRRPISIHHADRDTGIIQIMFQVVGKGTAWLSQRQDGFLDVLGPLGRGFTLSPVDSGLPLAVVGGGIGAAPLYFLLVELAALGRASATTVLLGAHSAVQLLLQKEAQELGFALRSATDDGSAGYHGLVTDLLEEELNKATSQRPAFVYACGPSPMLAKICAILEESGVPGEVSVEERMGCGVGACLSCVCRVKNGVSFAYKHACVDGPVLQASEVIW